MELIITPPKPVKSPKLESIFKEVCDIFELEVENVKMKNRTEDVLYARFIYAHVARTLTHKKWSDISRVMGGKEHSKALYSAKKAKDLISVKDYSFYPVWEYYLSKTNIFPQELQTV